MISTRPHLLIYLRVLVMSRMDLDQLASLQAFMGWPGDVDIEDYGGVPERRSEDPVCNFAGHQLGFLCRSQGLLVLNGRVPGDREGCLTFPRGEAGGSMIFVSLRLVFSVVPSRCDWVSCWPPQAGCQPIIDRSPWYLIC